MCLLPDTAILFHSALFLRAEKNFVRAYDLNFGSHARSFFLRVPWCTNKTAATVLSQRLADGSFADNHRTGASDLHMHHHQPPQHPDPRSVRPRPAGSPRSCETHLDVIGLELGGQLSTRNSHLCPRKWTRAEDLYPIRHIQPLAEDSSPVAAGSTTTPSQVLLQPTSSSKMSPLAEKKVSWIRSLDSHKI